MVPAHTEFAVTMFQRHFFSGSRRTQSWLYKGEKNLPPNENLH